MRALLAIALLVAAHVVAEDASSRHVEAGVIGSNGVKQQVTIKINKLVSFKDSAALKLDLGIHATTVAELIATRPTVLLTLGGVPTMSGTVDAKGVIKGEQFTAKLINKGLGIKITIRNQNLAGLLSTLSNQPDHGHIDIVIQNLKPSSPNVPKDFEMDVKESTKVLSARARKI